MAGEKHTDHAERALPVIAALLRRFNDGIPDDERRHMFAQFVFRLVGTRGTSAIELQRAWMAADRAIRIGTPMFLELVTSLVVHAKELWALPRVTPETLSIARMAVFAARSASGAAFWSAAAEAVAAAAVAAAEAVAAAAEVVAAAEAVAAAAEAAAAEAVAAAAEAEAVKASAAERPEDMS